MKPKYRVLVTDGWTRKALPVVRALGLAGHDCYVVANSLTSSAAFSRFCRGSFFADDPKRAPKRFVGTLGKLVKKLSIDCVLPLEEATIDAIIRSDLEQGIGVPVAMPPAESYKIASDKELTIHLAGSAGVPAPLTIVPHTLAAARAAGKDIGYPLIMKPARSSGSRGVRLIRDAEELADSYEAALSQYGRVLLQEYIPNDGPGSGVGIAAVDGKVTAAFSYQRIREFPISGGPSTLRVSTDNPELREHARTLMEALGWNGVAMVEFKFDKRAGKHLLMEINPRLWGSLALATYAGINFPVLAVEAALGVASTVSPYSVGIMCRWLVPGDIARFLADRNRLAMTPSFFKFRAPDLYYDEFDSRDIAGSIATVVSTALSVFDIKTWRLGVFRR